MTRHIPRKRFGQNFLTDRQVIADILSAIHPRKDDLLVEIGPGMGALTRPLLQSAGQLHVVEIDRDIIERLREEFSGKQLNIHSGDALEFDFSAIGQDLRVVGNLPYNISTPLLFHLSRYASGLKDMHFMLQKEVVERMVATPSTPAYGRLSVMLQSRFEMEGLFIVPSECFHPVPKVESAVVRMLPLRQPRIDSSKERLFAEIVSAAFSQRRKTLRNTLHGYLKAEDYAVLEINPGLRAENLSVTQYVAIADYLSKRLYPS